MKKRLRQSLSLFLCAVFLFTAALPALAAEPAPTVYVIGQGWTVVRPDGEVVTDFSWDTDFLTAAVKDCMPAFLKAVAFSTDRNVNAYAEKLAATIAPLYEKAKYNENGEKTDGSDVQFDPAAQLLPQRENFYDFVYDWRDDPRIVADKLAVYIDHVREATGAPKVNLVGRCEGSCSVIAYLTRYGHDKIRRIFFLNPAFYGNIIGNGVLSGKVHFEAKPTREWLDLLVNNEIPDVPLDASLTTAPYWALLKATVRTVYESYGLDFTLAALNVLFRRMFRPALRAVMKTGYATWPGIWAMVNEDNVEDAISFLFEGEEDVYAGLIEKIRSYERDVRAKAPETLRACAADGAAVGVLTKYGYASMPLFEGSDRLSDGLSVTAQSSFGATTAPQGGTFSDAYMAAAKANGTDKYISPDKKVDCSTCLFPDTTWIVGRCKHQWFPTCFTDFIARFMDSETVMTVNSDPAYPQYLLLSEDQACLLPLTAENAGEAVVEPEQRGFFRALTEFYKQLFAWLRQFLRSLPERIAK